MAKPQDCLLVFGGGSGLNYGDVLITGDLLIIHRSETA